MKAGQEEHPLHNPNNSLMVSADIYRHASFPSHAILFHADATGNSDRVVQCFPACQRINSCRGAVLLTPWGQQIYRATSTHGLSRTHMRSCISGQNYVDVTRWKRAYAIHVALCVAECHNRILSITSVQ